MTKNKLTLAALCLLFCGIQAFAQSKLSIDKVYSVTLRNSGTIIANEQIKGYYFFYQSDKIDRKTNEYTLQIVDENLNKLKDIKFTDSKNIALLESSFNGTSIAFLFHDEDEKTLEYRLYSLDGKMSYTYTKTMDKKSEAYFKQMLAMSGGKEDSENQNVFDIEGRGFVSITPVREDKKYTYDVNFYASDKRRMWTYNPIEDGKFSSAHYLGANDSVAVIEVLSKDKLMSRELTSTILGINLDNGRKAFEIRTQDGKNQLYPMNISKINGNTSAFLLIGPYYEGDDKVLKDKSDGLGIWLMNNQGKMIKSKYASWAKDMNKFLTVDQKGRIGDMGYVYFHKLLQTEDGKIFAIGEGYKKAANGLGIAMNILTQSYSSGMTKLVITDMLLLQLTSNFDVEFAKIYEKNKNNFDLGTGNDFSSPHVLAVAAKTYGAFDYAYTQSGQNKSSFVSGYMDYEKSKDYKGRTFNSISYYDGKISTDKINLETKATSLRVLPAKPGSILIVEYYKKEKKLEMRMEKIN